MGSTRRKWLWRPTLALGGALMLALSLGSPVLLGTAPDPIALMAARELDWRLRDIEVSPMPGLAAREGCQFWVATNINTTHHIQYAYAQLKDGSYIGPYSAMADPSLQRLARLLQQCGAKADAMWWARVVHAFSARDPRVALGPVVDESPSGGAKLKLKERGVFDTMPQLTRAGGNTTLRYYAHEMETDVTSEVNMVLHADGRLKLSHKTM